MMRPQQVVDWSTAPSIALCIDFVPGIEFLPLVVEEALLGWLLLWTETTG